MPDEETAPSPSALARAELARTRANVCACGVRPETCPNHKPEEGSDVAR
jgi:hypothetical protein